MKEQIKETMLNLLTPRLKLLKIAPEDVEEEVSLVQQGVLDSVDFIDFVMQIENQFDIIIEFDEMDATDFTSINQLCDLVEQYKKSV